MVYRGDLGDALPTGRKSIFFLTNSIAAKVVFSVLDILSVNVQSESSDSSRVSNGPASLGEFIDVENHPRILPLTVMLKLSFFRKMSLQCIFNGDLGLALTCLRHT